MEKLLATVKSFDQSKKDNCFIVSSDKVQKFVEECVNQNQFVIFSSYIPEYE